MGKINVKIGCYNRISNYQFKEGITAFEHKINVKYESYDYSFERLNYEGKQYFINCPVCNDELLINVYSIRNTNAKKSIYPASFVGVLLLTILLVDIAIKASRMGNPSSPGYWILVFFMVFPLLITISLSFSFKNTKLSNIANIMKGNTAIDTDFKIMKHKILD
jgi:hypothetical protein